MVLINVFFKLFDDLYEDIFFKKFGKSWLILLKMVLKMFRYVCGVCSEDCKL